jgi:hypothetical protein
MRNNQQIIQETRLRFMEQKRVAAARRRHAKTGKERAQAEITLILDDLLAEGLTLETPMGVQCYLRILLEKTKNLDEAAYRRFIDWPDYY